MRMCISGSVNDEKFNSIKQFEVELHLCACSEAFSCITMLFQTVDTNLQLSISSSL